MSVRKSPYRLSHGHPEALETRQSQYYDSRLELERSVLGSVSASASARSQTRITYFSLTPLILILILAPSNVRRETRNVKPER